MINNKNYKKQRSKPKRNKLKSRLGGLGNTPPQLDNVNPSYRHTYRFSMTNATVNISSTNILLALGGVQNSTLNSVSAWCGSFKLHSIKMWAPSASNALAIASVVWEGGSFGVSKRVQDASISITTPATLSTSPPQGCTASFWQSTNAANALFSISTNVSNTIVDVDVESRMSDNQNAQPTATTVAGGASGTILYMGLDGLASATSKFVPLSLPTN